MTVKQLIARLKELDGNDEIIMASDAEGNSFHNIDEVAHFSATGTQACIFPKHDMINPKY